MQLELETIHPTKSEILSECLSIKYIMHLSITLMFFVLLKQISKLNWSCNDENLSFDLQASFKSNTILKEKEYTCNAAYY